MNVLPLVSRGILVSSVVESLSSCQLMWENWKVWQQATGFTLVPVPSAQQQKGGVRSGWTLVQFLLAGGSFQGMKSNIEVATFLLDTKVLLANWEAILTLSP